MLLPYSYYVYDASIKTFLVVCCFSIWCYSCFTYYGKGILIVWCEHRVVSSSSAVQLLIKTFAMSCKTKTFSTNKAQVQLLSSSSSSSLRAWKILYFIYGFTWKNSHNHILANYKWVFSCIGEDLKNFVVITIRRLTYLKYGS